MKSPLNSRIEDLHPDLARLYKISLERYEKKYPLGPKITLNETYRNQLIQDAYHAQGRMNLAPLNALRQKAGLWPLKLEEARETVSNAKFGQSPHNFLPSRAFDVRAEKDGKYIGGKSPYFYFWLIVMETAQQLRMEVVWGGQWQDWPHVELKHWRKL
jgi:peptidoglycan L-alanyl-D-glutamate endopeptidase CwlK